MRLLQRYVLRELLLPLIISVFFFTVVMVISQLFKETDLLLRTGVSGKLIFRLLGILMVSMLTITVPMGVLLATLIGFGRLASEREILAMRAAGLSLWSVFWPVIVAATAISLALMALNFNYVPRLLAGAQQLKNDILFEGIYNLQPGTFHSDPWDSDSNLTIYYDRREEIRSAVGKMELNMHDIAVWLQVETDQSNNERLMLIFSETGQILADPDSRSIELHLENGTLNPIDQPDPEESMVVAFKRASKILRPGIDNVNWSDRIREMNLGEIVGLIRTEKPSTAMYKDSGRISGAWKNYFRLYNELIMRLSLPLACIAFVLIGMPLAVVVRPGAKTVSFVITFVLMFVYYMILSYGRELGVRGQPFGWLLMISPNILLAAIGVPLMIRTNRQ